MRCPPWLEGPGSVYSYCSSCFSAKLLLCSSPQISSVMKKCVEMTDRAASRWRCLLPTPMFAQHVHQEIPLLLRACGCHVKCIVCFTSVTCCALKELVNYLVLSTQDHMQTLSKKTNQHCNACFVHYLLIFALHYLYMEKVYSGHTSLSWPS